MRPNFFQLELLTLNIYLATAAHWKQRLKWPFSSGLGEGVVIRLSAFLGIVGTNRVWETLRKSSLFQ